MPKRAYRRRGLERRQAILDAAVELYARDGFRGTGLTAIGEKVGISHAAVLYHFGSSEGLLRAVLEERDRRATERFIPLFQNGGIDALRRLPEVARLHLSEPGLGRLYTVLQTENLDSDSIVHSYFLKRRRNLHDALAKLLRRGQEAGEFRPDLDPEHKADEMIAFMEGAQLQQLLDPERIDLMAVYEGYVRALVHDVAARPPAETDAAPPGVEGAPPPEQTGRTDAPGPRIFSP